MDCKQILDKINHISNKKINIMEVCGTHTNVISSLGIKTRISSNINLLSGPGCPVCVAHESYIDSAIELLKNDDVIIVSFGDLLRVKGTKYSLLDKKLSRNIRIIYSPFEAILVAKENKDKKIVMLSIGFETMAPIIASVVRKTIEEKITNLFFYNALKVMEPILRHVLKQEDCKIDGFICPGNVAAITGSDYFKFIIDEYNIPSAICGFSDFEIITGIYHIVKQLEYNEDAKLINSYSNVVKPEGNIVARDLINEYFEHVDEWWRGIGNIKSSGLKLKKEYEYLDAEAEFSIEKGEDNKSNSCNCGDVLLGKIISNECKLFGKICTPTSPKGPCMVSKEGSCNAIYRYMKVIDNG